MSKIVLGEVSLDKMVRAVEKVRERLQRATRALGDAGIPYAVVGGNAVAAWVSRVDEAAVRNTPDVDILLRREDLERAEEELTKVGFIAHHTVNEVTFLDGPDAKERDAVHIVFAGEKVRDEHALTAPDVDDSDATGKFRVVALEALVLLKLTSYRMKDRMHLRDLIDVDLVDTTWVNRLPADLAERLQLLLDNPDG